MYEVSFWEGYAICACIVGVIWLMTVAIQYIKARHDHDFEDQEILKSALVITPLVILLWPLVLFYFTFVDN